jgi:hypothetical protein
MKPKDAHGGPAQAAATADTLQYFLGMGRKRKSWMYPNDQPSNSTLQIPQPATTTSTTSTASTPTLTSPQLANLAPHTANGRLAALPITVLPSPSPSEETVVESRLTPNPLNHTSPQETETNQAYATPRDDSPDIRFMEGVRQAAAALASKRPVDTAPSADSDKRMRLDSVAQPERRLQINPSQSDNLRRASLGHRQSASPLMSPLFDQNHTLRVDRRSSQSPFMRHPQQGPQPATAQTAGHVPQPQPTLNPPSTQSVSRGTILQSSGAFPPVRNNFHAPPLQAAPQQFPALASAWYTKEQCMQVLLAFRNAYPVTHDHRLRDAKRLEVLQRAVEEQDWAYLLMHQCYCLLSCDPNSLPKELTRLPNLPFATQMMKECLDSNDKLSSHTLVFFSQFPMPLAYLSNHYPQRLFREQNALANAIECSVHFNNLKAACEQRNSLPLMRELAGGLGITSTVFQRIVFTAIVRRLLSVWKGTNELIRAQFETQAITIFTSCQRHYNHQVHNPPSHEIEQREREQEMHYWGTKLKHLCDSTRAKLQQGMSITSLSGQDPSGHMVYQQNQQQTSVLSGPLQTQGQYCTPHYEPMSLHSTQAAIQSGRPRGLPRLQQNQPRSQPAPLNQQAPTPFIAPPGFHLPQQRLPDPARFATHQANLRSPILKPHSAQSPLYQYVQGFIKPPVRLGDAGHKIEKWIFTLTREDLQLPIDRTASAPGAPPIIMVNEQTRMLRLRCVKWPEPDLPNEHTWSVTDTSWIPTSYFTFNGVHLHQRKKTHHGKDLPIDMTCHAKEGENTLEIAIMRQNNDENYRKYLVAIELLGMKNHSTILNECRGVNHITAETIKAHIKKRLTGATNDDDEIAIVQSSITINLLDPFSISKMCDIPARGKACLHYDCFDLETFLSTRKWSGQVTAADTWKCPICNHDVRPQHLIVDGFIEEVRDQLLQQGLPQTRAIIVDQALAWTPKVEVLDGVQDRDTPDNDDRVSSSRRASAQVYSRGTIPAGAEIVDLSD